MKKLLLLLIGLHTCSLFSQKEKLDDLLSSISNESCNCIDSIQTFNQSKSELTAKISSCISKQVAVYQTGIKLKDIRKNLNDSVSEINIVINKGSKEYQKYYYEIERYLMENCTSLKEKIATEEKLSKNSLSESNKAMDLYTKGYEESKKGDFKKAVKESPNFAFAWDNLGLSYRRLNDFDKAIAAYEKSLSINPNGLMPLQNIAIVYQYKKEYQKAIVAYERLSDIDKNNPEVFYGIGNIYATALNDYEKGLDYMCKAYNLYIAQKSPYRTDAEKLINIIYSKMKAQKNIDVFNQVLENNNITPSN